MKRRRSESDGHGGWRPSNETKRKKNRRVENQLALLAADRASTLLEVVSANLTSTPDTFDKKHFCTALTKLRGFYDGAGGEERSVLMMDPRVDKLVEMIIKYMPAYDAKSLTFILHHLTAIDRLSVDAIDAFTRRFRVAFKFVELPNCALFVNDAAKRYNDFSDEVFHLAMSRIGTIADTAPAIFTPFDFALIFSASYAPQP